MCIAKIGEIIKIEGKEALVRFGKEIERVNISLLKSVKAKDKIICSEKVAVEKLED